MRPDAKVRPVALSERYADGDTAPALKREGIDIFRVLEDNDAYRALEKSGGLTVDEAQALALVQLPKADIAQAVFGTTLERFSARSRQAYSGQQMLEEYVSFYQSL